MKKLIITVALACASLGAHAEQAPHGAMAMCSHVYEVAHLAAQGRALGESLPQLQGEFTHAGDKGEIEQVFKDPSLQGRKPDEVAAAIRVECLAYTGALGKPHDSE